MCWNQSNAMNWAKFWYKIQQVRLFEEASELVLSKNWEKWSAKGVPMNLTWKSPLEQKPEIDSPLKSDPQSKLDSYLTQNLKLTFSVTQTWSLIKPYLKETKRFVIRDPDRAQN